MIKVLFINDHTPPNCVIVRKIITSNLHKASSLSILNASRRQLIDHGNSVRLRRCEGFNIGLDQSSRCIDIHVLDYCMLLVDTLFSTNLLKTLSRLSSESLFRIWYCVSHWKSQPLIHAKQTVCSRRSFQCSRVQKSCACISPSRSMDCE